LAKLSRGIGDPQNIGANWIDKLDWLARFKHDFASGWDEVEAASFAAAVTSLVTFPALLSPILCFFDRLSIPKPPSTHESTPESTAAGTKRN
jgi:hypothetical protein